MKVSKKQLNRKIREIYIEEKNILGNESKIRSNVRSYLKEFLTEFEDRNNNGIPDDWEHDPKNPINARFETSFGNEASIKNIIKNPDHPDYDKAKALLDKQKQDPKLQDYVNKKYPQVDLDSADDEYDPDSPPGGTQPLPQSADGEDEGEIGSVFGKGDETDGETEVSVGDDDDYLDPQKDASFIYGDDDDLPTILTVKKSFDLPKYWKTLEKYGKEDKIASGKRTSSFVYKTKKRQHGARITPGGES